MSLSKCRSCLVCHAPFPLSGGRKKFCSLKCQNRMRTLRRNNEEKIGTASVRASGMKRGTRYLAIEGQEDRVALYARLAEAGVDLFEGIRQ
jgi:hypothetical protein